MQTNESADTTFIDVKLKVVSSNGRQNRMNLTFLNVEHRRSNRRTSSNNSYSGYNGVYDSILAYTLGKTLEVSINEKGEVETVRGYPEMVASIASALTVDKRSVYQELNDYASDAAVQDILNRLFAFFPNKEVKVGDNWGNTITMVAKAPINFNSLYTLNKIAGDSIFIGIDSKIVGGTSNYHLNGTESGTVVLNEKTHLPYFYTSNSSSTTNTNYYDVHDWDQWVITLRYHQRK